MENARRLLDDFLSDHGIGLDVLGKAMEQFCQTVFELPEDAVCRPGCAYCCSLRVGVSIPELLVIFYELKAQAHPEVLAALKARILGMFRILCHGFGSRICLSASGSKSQVREWAFNQPRRRS
ncbi:MAG: hypothetical protein HUN05_06325 [Desulfobacter sp.]|nr:MAG: hypothetical protein HUN05_06325 [Desulfobacter sp.]